MPFGVEPHRCLGAAMGQYARIVQRRIMGIETEFGVTCTFHGHRPAVAIGADGALDGPEQRIAELARQVTERRSCADTFGPDAEPRSDS
jgi:hypothetical protein